MYKFGTTSKKRMQGVDPLLLECAERALALSKFDMSIPWMGGLRTAEEQNAIFKDGNSKFDGYEKKSYHQSGKAIDIIPVGKEPYNNTRAMNHYANLMLFVWQIMIREGKTDKIMRWGGTFGASGWDKPHYEIK